jgi:hypothetical protein
MSDRCYLSITVEAGKVKLFKQIVFGGDDVELEESTDLAVTMVDYEANYALYDELVEAAKNEILFYGYHGSGSEYGAGLFFSKGGLYHEWEISSANNGYCVVVDKDGTIPQEEQEKLRMFILARADAEKRLSDMLYALVAEDA